jgi:hypothetical protein
VKKALPLFLLAAFVSAHAGKPTPKPSTLQATITSPTASSTVSSPVQFYGTTSGASRSQLLVDGATYASYQTAIVSATLNLPAGAHQIVLQAFSKRGAKATASETITVQGTSPPPQAAITSPAPGASVASPVQFTGTTTDSTHSELDVDGVAYGTYQTSTVSVSLTLTPGTHQIALLAFNDTGAKVTTSESITVQAPPPPQAAITSPAPGATVTSPVQFTGTTTNSTRSELDIDGVAYGTYQTSTLSISLKLTSGTHQIALLAFNDTGAKVTTSESITVQAPPPPSSVPTVSVKTYGATGDGSTDDTAAINAAIAAIPSSGAMLYFPCGTYLVLGQISAISTSNTTVTGDGTCSIIKPTGSSTITGLRVAGSGLGPSSNLAADTTTNTFTTAIGALASAGITAGSYVLVSTVPTATNGPNSPLIGDQQTVKVISVAGDTATIDNQFSLQFTVAAGSFVQRIINPVVNDVISNLVIDGSSNTGSGSMGLALSYAANSAILNMTVRNFLGTGGSGGYIIDTGYNNSLTSSSCLYCGNGGSNGRPSMIWQRQSYGTVSNLTVTNKSTQSVFGVGFHEAHFTTADTITVDHGGASGRVFKLQRADNNTFNAVTANNGTGGDNGITISDQSSYNTFNNCVANNNQGKGIALFGNYNTHNTFNNCTAKFNTMAAFAQGPDYAGNYHDNYTTVTGGTFCCQRVNSSNLVALHSTSTVFTGANVYDDLNLAANGLVGDGSLAVTNNTFSGLPHARDLYVNTGLSISIYTPNTTPDGTTPAF